MDSFEMSALMAQQQSLRNPYLEFLKVPDLSMGLYVLEAGASDTQKPHTEDEVYYVVSGKAAITVGTEQRPVQPGSLIYVKTGDPHFFHTITEKLTLLVFFAPAEYTRG